MTSNTHRRRRRRASAGLIGVLAAITVAGCAETADLPPEEKDAINAGRNAEVGVVSADNLLLISTAEEEPGRLLGLLTTTSGEPVEVTFADADEEITVTVDPSDAEAPDGYSFEENEHIFRTSEAPPGALAEITVSVEGESEELRIPVLDGSLERYRPFVPEG
ncbi:hypothetical protein ACFFGH_11330 [Lysobacter korlensis]|uniref:Uncharacterized protein n=1 Tax=Lysobacter korlensis TaxID=553636 RepID=A0ABV6RPC2_9GAMM